MAEASPDKIVIGAIGPLITTVIGAVIGWLPGGLTGAIGSALTTLLAAVGAISGLAFSLMYKRYVGVLGASVHPNNLRARTKGQTERNAYAERQAYDQLRESLRGGNIAARLYTDWLTKFLDGVDRFFGDAGKADQTLFPHAFGLRTPAPLWTAPAFDRCLLLALLYPLVAILIIWAASGHVGPAERALDLTRAVSGWMRGLVVAAIGISAFVCWRSIRWRRWYIIFTINLVLLTGIFAFAVTGSTALLFVGSFLILAVTAALALLSTGAGAVAFAVTFSIPVGIAFGIGVEVAVIVVGAATVVVALVSNIAIRHRKQGVFLLLFFVALVFGCLVAAQSLSFLPLWWGEGPILLFSGLLTLFNAPFDWASLGLTRALLRRGLELKGWWPFLLATADALAAAASVALLTPTMVIGVQAFDALAARGGHEPMMPLVARLDHYYSAPPLLDGIADHPEAPEYWWVYALLLSTMIPSLLNLMIGGASLLRGIPGLPALLLRFMPAGKAVPAFDRTWLALVLTCQVFAGAFLGIAAQFVLAIGVIFYLLPWMGLELLDTARAVAEFDLPMRVLGLWWGNP